MLSTLTYVHVLAFVLLVAFLTYVVAILVPFVRRSRTVPGDASTYEWHFFVPCLNEELVIGQTLDRFVRDFPDAHVWIVDDDSDDATAAIVAARAARDGRVHLVSRKRPDARMGKGAALNAAYRVLGEHLAGREVASDRVIVGVLDADGELVPGALELMAATDVFGDAAVGAAQASVAMNNTGIDLHTSGPGWERWAKNLWSRWLLRCQDIEFRTTIAAMQTLRLRTSSSGMGGNGQFTRLSALDAIAATYGEPWHGALLEDYELGIHAILVGYETRYVHDAVVRQEALPSMRAYLRQRTRWSQGGMQCARYIPEIFSSRNFTNAAALESTYFLLIPWTGLVGVFLWPIVGLSVVADGAANFDSILEWARFVWWLWPLTILTGILPFVIWAFVYRVTDDPQAGLLRTTARGLGYWLYTYATYPVLLRALGRVVRGRSGWEKTNRVGAQGAPVTAPPAAAAPVEHRQPSLEIAA